MPSSTSHTYGQWWYEWANDYDQQHGRQSLRYSIVAERVAPDHCEYEELVAYVDRPEDLRLFMAAPAMLAALKALVNMQKGRENWPEVQAAEAAIAAAEPKPPEEDHAI